MLDITVRTNGSLRVEATDGVATTVLDEPVAAGGGGEGLTPQQTVLAALGGCTAMTLKLYSARKGFPLRDVRVRVTLEPGAQGEANQFTQHVTLEGDLDEAQRTRLMQIAGRCPVHRLLEGSNEFTEVAAEPAGAE